MKAKILLLSIGIFLTQCVAHAQEGTLIASVDRTEIGMGDQIELTFTLSGSTNARNFRAPMMNDFLILSGPNQSTNVQFINGSVSQAVTLSYVLQPKAEGKFTIGAATAEYGGKVVQSQPLAITVTKASRQQTQAQQNRGNQSADLEKAIGNDLLLRVSVDKSKVVQGEQITATYKLYSRVNLSNLDIKQPAFTGFWNEDVEEIKQYKYASENESINGKQYHVILLKKVALFPQRSGSFDIDPMEAICVVQVRDRRRSNNPLDQFFNDPFFSDPFGGVSNVNYKIKSDPVKISVAPLPSTSVPDGFNGAVGKFTMDAWLEKRETKTNEPVTMKVKISGRGNIKLLEAPAVQIPPDVEKYDPKISDNIGRDGNAISGSRTFEYLLIPRHAGEQRIPSFSFSYFDPEKKSFVHLTSPEFAMSVEKGSEIAAAPTSGISKEDVKLLGEDIHFIRSEHGILEPQGEQFAGSVKFYLLSLSPILSFIGFIFVVRRRERIAGDVISLRMRKARKMAQRRLVEAKKFLHHKKREEFYSEISRALWGYVADKLSISPADSSIDSIRQALGVRGIPVDVVSKLTATIEQCEFARFAPSSDAMKMDDVYRESVELISTIEDHIR